MAVSVMLRATAAATGFVEEVLVGFALIGTNILSWWKAKATMCVALICDRKTQDSQRSQSAHQNVH
jgi:hypothetical protein